MTEDELAAEFRRVSQAPQCMAENWERMRKRASDVVAVIKRSEFKVVQK